MADSIAYLYDINGNGIGSYRLEVMGTFWQRFMGLMGRTDQPLGNAALFERCSSIHMFFMKIPLDVIWYGVEGPDGCNRVLAVSRNVAPWRLAFGPKGTKGCLEVAAGTVPTSIDRIKLKIENKDVSGERISRPDYREVVRGCIQVTRAAACHPHLGGAAAIFEERPH